MTSLYRAALALLLPRTVREADGEEMVGAFRSLWLDAEGTGRRIRIAFLAFGRLPRVAAAEWLEQIGVTGSPGSRPPGRRNTMSGWSTHLRLAPRALWKAPAFTVTVVLLLGLGVGAVTVMFTVVDNVVLRRLPYPSADRLVTLENGSHPGPFYQELQALNAVDLWVASFEETAVLVGEGEPLRVSQGMVSEDFFAFFGARPARGRLLVREDFGTSDVAVLSHGAWLDLFGGDPEIVGRDIRLNGASVTVVGVLDRSFTPPEGGPASDGGADVWRPLDWGNEELSRIGYHVLTIAGRLAPGATLSDLAAEVERVNGALADRYPDDWTTREGEPYATPPAYLQELSTRRVRSGLFLLLGAVGLLLLVTCLNLAHLFLARGIGRVREMAVRRALGAGMGSLVRQLLAECLILGALGALLGVGLAEVGLRTFMALNPTSLPWGERIGVDLRILLFTSSVAAGTVLLFGLLPALRSTGGDLVRDLRGAGRSATAGRGMLRMRGGLVVVEVALSVMLVAGAALFLRSFLRIQAVDPGVAADEIWTIPLTPTEPTTPEEYRLAMQPVEAALAAVPGVVSATHALSLPHEFTGGGRCCWSTSSLEADGEALEGVRIALHPVTESYFETLGIPLLAGRAWSEAEAPTEPWPAVLNEGLALRLFGSAERAVGRELRVGGSGTPVRITGVARDVHHYGLDQEIPVSLYLPMEHLPFAIPVAHMAVRVRGGATAGLGGRVREAVWAAAPDLPVPAVRPMREWIERSTAGRKFDSVLFGSFGGLALLLAAAGLYGTLLYTVGQRRREVGIRMALGAARRRVEGQVVRQGLLLASVGCGLGLVGSWAAGRFLQSRLFELEASDPSTLGLAAVTLLAASALASWLPARRAAGVDPMEVLREE